LFVTEDMVSPGTRSFVENQGADILQKPFRLDELRRRMEKFAVAWGVRLAAAEVPRGPDLSAGPAGLARSGAS